MFILLHIDTRFPISNPFKIHTMHGSGLHGVCFFLLFATENVLVPHHRGDIFLLDYVLELTHPKQEEFAL